MKKWLLLFIAIIMAPAAVPACTTFFLQRNDQMVFGRNYDWLTGNGMVCTNHRGLSKTSYPVKDGETISWMSRYGSITFNQYGKEFPTGGMNEKGLVVELMWLDGTQYPAPDHRPAVGVLQWIQYQLDNCSTVEEVIAADEKLRIASTGTTPLHYLIADAGGRVATIEFLAGKMKVHTGEDLPFPVLTNTAYSQSVSLSKQVVQNSSTSISFRDNSVERFAKACSMVRQYQQVAEITLPIVDYSFTILDKVAQGAHTRWSIVYDITQKQVYFKSLDYPLVKTLSFAAFDLGCNAPAMVLDINQAAGGEVNRLFRPFSTEWNTEMVARSFEESKPQLNVPAETAAKLSRYAGSISCPYLPK